MDSSEATTNQSNESPAVIIPAAGSNHSKILPFSEDLPDALMPLNSKPILDFILEELERQKLTDVMILIKEGQESLFSTTFKKYGKRFNFSIVPVTNSKSLVDTLAVAAGKIKTKNVLIVLSDTIFSTNLDLLRSTVYYKETKDCFRWCLAEQNKDGSLSKLIDKPKNYQKPYRALVGVYYFTDAALFFRSLLNARKNDKKEISAAISGMIASNHPVFLKECEKWIDCGSADSYYRAKRILLNSRHFNSIDVEETYGILSKTSMDNHKLKREYQWYTRLPAEFQSFAPRTFSFEENQSGATLKIEYYGYPSLSEYLVYTPVPIDLWDSMLDHLFEVLNLFYATKGNLKESDFIDMYINKNEERIKTLTESGPMWKKWVETESWEINGKKCIGYQKIMEWLKKQDFYDKKDICITHGDMCFTNILYDLNGHTLKLIDPRGYFGKGGVYGDIKYDLAKLRHSAHGKYDFIINDLFSIKQNGNRIEYEIYSNDLTEGVAMKLDERIKNMGYDVSRIQAIEGMLFLSMIPLHSDKPERQKMMGARALELLTEVYHENCNRS